MRRRVFFRKATLDKWLEEQEHSKTKGANHG
jgi:hypothetical protein